MLARNPQILETALRRVSKRKKSARPEQVIHRAVVQHLEARGVPGMLFLHVPNGGWRSHTEAAILKGMGVRKGASDLLFWHKNRTFALELKASGGKPPTVEQMQFMSDFNAAGGYGCIVEGLDRALKVLETWGLLKGEAQ